MADLTIEEIEEDIADTRAAIRRVLVAQAQAGQGGAYVTRANLDALRRHLDALREEYRVRSGEGGPVMTVGIRRRD